MITLTPKELATILYALRNLQLDMVGDSQFAGEMKNAEHFHDVEPPSLEFIDNLCEYLNT